MIRFNTTYLLFGADDLSDTDLITEEKVKELGMMAWKGVFPKLQQRMGKGSLQKKCTLWSDTPSPQL